MSFDLAVVGAGIVGSACAFEAARAGLRVAVIEEAFPGSGATAAGMGHIVAMDDSDAQFALTRYSRELWAELARELPADCEYANCGTLWIAADAEEMAEVDRKSRFYGSRGGAVEVLDAQALRDEEPHLREGLAGALLVSEDSVVYPPCVARYLLAQQRVTLRTGRAMRITENTIHLADGDTIHAEAIVNAAGIHAARLTPELPIDIQPRKGHLLITDRYPGFVRHQLVELGYLKSAHSTTADSVAFNVQPRASGQILIGSSRQFGSASPEMDNRILNAMLARAIEYMPGIARLSAIRGWTGFRAATADKLPLIGLIPGYRNVYVAAGHEGLGITTSLATGRLLIDRILHRTSAIDMEPYRPERPCLAHA